MRKSIVIYFSRADENYFGGEMKYIDKGNTEIIAEYIKDLTGADLFKVEPLNPYSEKYMECIEEANRMTKDEEGFVVVDKNYNRIKVKSPEYLRAARLANNNVVTIKRIVKMIREEQIDDFMAYCPQYIEEVEQIIAALTKMEEEAEKEWAEVKELAWKEKKEFVRIVRDNGFKWPHYLYWKYNDNGRAPSQFFNNMTLKKIVELIRRELDEKSN